MFELNDQNGPKKPATPNINSDLPKDKQEQQWLKQHKTAIEAYNKSVDDNGSFSDDLRSF